MKAFQSLLSLIVGALATGVVTSDPLTEFSLDERPEGITSGPGSTLYVSQILSGKVLAIDANTGVTETVVDTQADRQAWGLSYHEDGYLFVGGGGPSFGGGTPEVYVYNVETGESVVACSPLSANETGNGVFINDVTILEGVAYITNSFSNRLMAMDVADALAGNCTVWELFLPDDFIPRNAEEWGANGIVAYEFENGLTGLLVAHEIFGSVWSIQNYENDGTPPQYQPIIYDHGGPGGVAAPGADGLTMVENNLLYVTQNSENLISVYNLTADENGVLFQTKLGELTSPEYDTPATSAAYDGYMFSTNSRFLSLTEISDEADDNVVGVRNIFCCGRNATEEMMMMDNEDGGGDDPMDDADGDETEAPTGDPSADDGGSDTQSPNSGSRSRNCGPHLLSGFAATALGVGLLSYLV